MNPSFGADLMSLSGDLLEDLGKILDCNTSREKARLNFLLFEYIEHPVDTHPLAEFPISNNREIFLCDSSGWKTTAIFLLQSLRPAQILGPGFKGHARRNGNARAVGPFNR
jgi:hypothetical protein